MADAELLVVCIDNSYAAYKTIKDQYAAVKLYCKKKLAANRETQVMVFTMGSSDFRCVLCRATSNYKEIRRALKSICIGAGFLSLLRAISFASPVFCARLGNKKKRMLFLVGGLVDMCHTNAEQYGSRLKYLGISVDVVTFHLEEKPKHMTSENQFGRKELDEFVRAAQSEDNSHIEHVLAGSNIREVLSKSILKTLCDSRIKTDHREKAKRKNHSRNHHKKSQGKNHPAEDNEHVQTEALLTS